MNITDELYQLNSLYKLGIIKIKIFRFKIKQI